MRQFAPVDCNALSPGQRRAYDNIVQHSQQQPAQKQLLILVCGTAGTDKSHLIRALHLLIGKRIMLAGTTGMAAFLIGGKTLHSALRLPQSPFVDLLDTQALASL